jgi:hypothetical protein
MSLKYNHVPNVSQLIPVLGGTCVTSADCTSVNSTCNSDSTCECESGFVADSKNTTCLPGTLNYRTCLPHRVWLSLLYKQISRNSSHFPGFCFMYCSNDGNVLKTFTVQETHRTAKNNSQSVPYTSTRSKGF